MRKADLERFRFEGRRQGAGGKGGLLPIYSVVPVKGQRWLSLRHQQTRAMSLARALADDGRGPRTLAVIGAGLAGLTFAACYWHYRRKADTKVTVFERNPWTLWNLRGCRTRWVHPHFFSWPHLGWHVRHTLLPYLNWEAGSAHEVAKQLDAEWRRAETASKSGLTVKVDVQVTSCRPLEGQKLGVWYRSHGAPRNARNRVTVDALVLAMGPGLENRLNGALNHSYWHDDCVDRLDPYPPAGQPLHYVIAGSGDGALTDFLRSRLKHFVNHSEIARLAKEVSKPHVIQRAAGLEHSIEQFWDQVETRPRQERKPLNVEMQVLRKELQALEAATDDFRTSYVQPQLRRDTTANLLVQRVVKDKPSEVDGVPCDRDYLLNRNVAPIHRLLVSLVLTCDRAKAPPLLEYARYGKVQSGLVAASNAVAVQEQLCGRTWVAVEEQEGSGFAVTSDRLIARMGVNWTANPEAPAAPRALDFLDEKLRARPRWPRGSWDDPRWLHLAWTTPWKDLGRKPLEKPVLKVTQGRSAGPCDIRIGGTGKASIVISPRRDGTLVLAAPGRSPRRVLGPDDFPVVLLSEDLEDRRGVLLVRDLPPPPPSDASGRPLIDVHTVEGRLAALLGAELSALLVIPHGEPLGPGQWETWYLARLEEWRKALQLLMKSEPELLPKGLQLYVADGVPNRTTVQGWCEWELNDASTDT
jgi:hypothetical protein